jgi:ketosteroid isomerase-like protein
VTDQLHANARLLERLFQAFGRRDGPAVVTMFDRDVVWRVGGQNEMTGEYRGWREVVRFLRRTTDETDGTYRTQLLWALADDARGVAVYGARGQRNGRALDIEMVLLCEFSSDGRISNVVAAPVDSVAFDEFWGNVGA